LKGVGFDPEEGLENTDGIRVIKSGTDFREFSHLKLEIEERDDGKKHVQSISGKSLLNKNTSAYKRTKVNIV
jgi:hypothetical protein